MLAKTLRQLERDGLVTRQIHAEVPPHVGCKLTPHGESLGQSVCGVWTWVGVLRSIASPTQTLKEHQ